MYLGGLGATNPTPPEGAIPTVSSSLLANATAQIGGTGATIRFAGLSVLPGLYQINIVVPASLGEGDHAVTLTVGGQNTQPGVTLRVQP